MAHHAGGVGAEQEVLELGPLGGEQDEVGLDLFRHAQNLVIDRAVADNVLHLDRVGHVLELCPKVGDGDFRRRVL